MFEKILDFVLIFAFAYELYFLQISEPFVQFTDGVGGLFKHLEVKVSTNHGGCFQQFLRFFVQLVYPRQDYLVDGFRDVYLIDFVCHNKMVFFHLDDPFVEETAQDLFNKERIPFRFADDRFLYFPWKKLFTQQVFNKIFTFFLFQWINVDSGMVAWKLIHKEFQNIVPGFFIARPQHINEHYRVVERQFIK